METPSRTSYLKTVRRLVVKIGSSLIATYDRGLDPSRLAAIAGPAAELRRRGYEILMVSSGAILSGVKKLGLKNRPSSIPQKQAAAALGQSRLMWAYEQAFEPHGLPVAQVLLTAEDLSNRKRFLNSRNTLTTLLEFGALPVINENDTVAVEEIRFGDNDHLAGLVAHLMDAQLLVLMSDVEGLYTSDPRRSGAARLIHEVTEITPEIERLAEDTTSEGGTGGMGSKIQTAHRLAGYGVATAVIGGERPENLLRLMDGEEVGTLFFPRRNRQASRKHWIAHAARTRGRLVVDTGAATALMEKGKSLLPSGIVGVEGPFSAGDAVSCLDRNGRELAKGLVNYSSQEIEKIKGHKTVEIARILGYKGYDEVIHRDNLVIL
jgi:glutamate 5-kinase